jgi:hypothetical protein
MQRSIAPSILPIGYSLAGFICHGKSESWEAAMKSFVSAVVAVGITQMLVPSAIDAVAQPRNGGGPAQLPPNELPAQKHERVALFGCTPDNNCEITCTIFGKDVKFEKVPWAVVYKYPNSTRLWLQLGTGPNAHYLLGDAFCDFTNMPISNAQ